MNRYLSKFRPAAAISARTALVFAAGVFVLALVRVVLNGLFDGKWGFNWRYAAAFCAIFGAIFFCVQFAYTFFRLCAAVPAETILASVASGVAGKSGFSGFVAMEYYALILNRTFVVFIAPDALYGWKARGIITNLRPMYFQEYAQILNDRALMCNRDAIQKLAALKGGFVIPRSQILNVELIRRNKWGMGGIPQSGLIHIRLASGITREFILLGNVEAELIQQEILSGARAPR